MLEQPSSDHTYFLWSWLPQAQRQLFAQVKRHLSHTEAKTCKFGSCILYRFFSSCSQLLEFKTQQKSRTNHADSLYGLSQPLQEHRDDVGMGCCYGSQQLPPNLRVGFSGRHAHIRHLEQEQTRDVKQTTVLILTGDVYPKTLSLPHCPI